MTGSKSTLAEHDRTDDLRRRLYRADATAVDLQHYLDVPVVPEAPASVDELVLAPAPPPRRRRVGPGAAVALVVACGIVVAALLQQPLADQRRWTAPLQPARTVLQDVGSGRILAVDPTQVTGPTPVPIDVDGTPVVGRRFDGVGDAVVALDLPVTSSGAGQAAVAVSSTRGTPIAWRALRVATRKDRSSYQQVIAMQTITSEANFATPMTFTFTGGAPTRIVLEAPEGLRWTLLITAIPEGVEVSR